MNKKLDETEPSENRRRLLPCFDWDLSPSIWVVDVDSVNKNQVEGKK